MNGNSECAESTGVIEEEKKPRKSRIRYEMKSELDGGYWTNEMVGAMMEAEKAAA